MWFENSINWSIDMSYLVNPYMVTASGDITMWEELGRTTLGSAGDSIAVTGMDEKPFIMFVAQVTAETSDTFNPCFRFGNGSLDSGSNYARRRNVNGTPATSVSDSEITSNGSSKPNFIVGYVRNETDYEKTLQASFTARGSAGASNAPSSMELIGKWTNTSVQFDQFELLNNDIGSFDTGSQLVVLGHDPASTSGTFWELLDSEELTGTASTITSTFTSKKYLFVQSMLIGHGSISGGGITMNGDGASSAYARRYENNGGASATGVSENRLEEAGTATSGYIMQTHFICNISDQEKLVISRNYFGNTGASVVPDRRMLYGKWENTSEQIDTIMLTDNAGGDFDTGSTLKVWGSD